MSQWSNGKSLALIGPTKRLCHRSVEIGDKGQPFCLESSNRRKGAAFEQFASQNAEPNLNLVHPGSGLRRIVKHNVVGWICARKSASFRVGPAETCPTLPSATWKLTINDSVPCRRSSNSRCITRPGRMGRSGCFGCRACTPVISSALTVASARC